MQELARTYNDERKNTRRVAVSHLIDPSDEEVGCVNQVLLYATSASLGSSSSFSAVVGCFPILDVRPVNIDFCGMDHHFRDTHFDMGEENRLVRVPSNFFVNGTLFGRVRVC